MWFGGPVYVVAHVDAGRGRSRRSIDRLRAVLGPDDHLEPTRFAGHAVELARRAAEDGWPVIGAAGGDGTAHEVACGLLESGRDSTLAVLPLGSANDYAVALGLVPGWWSRPVEGVVRRRVDVGRATWAGGSRWFVNGVGMGFNGLVTVESRKVKHFRGLLLYGMAVWRALGKPRLSGPWHVNIDGFMREERPLMTVSVALGHREGNFTLTPRALLDLAQEWHLKQRLKFDQQLYLDGLQKRIQK
jgi:diacylglycerol kinase family enzyme